MGRHPKPSTSGDIRKSPSYFRFSPESGNRPHCSQFRLVPNCMARPCGARRTSKIDERESCNKPDGSDLTNPHGMAIKFHLPDGSDVGMVTNSLKFFLVSGGADSGICSWPSLLARPTRPSQHSASATGPKPDFVPRPRDALPQTSDIDRKTALADTGTTSWQTTARENKPRCDGRCVQSRYRGTFLSVMHWTARTRRGKPILVLDRLQLVL
jgi:hypothetical protein